MKRYLFLSIATLLLLVTCATGCGGQPTSIVPPDQPTAVPTQSDESVEETPVPTHQPQEEEAIMTPKPSPEATEVTPPAHAEHVVLLAQEDLAQRLDMSPEDILMVSVQAVDWPDASLGCPEPGMMYAQVITPGFRVVLEAEGQQYHYHSGGGNTVLCQQTDGGHGRPDPVVVDGHPWMPRDTDVLPTPPRR
jgi:hypothetical protein